MADHDRIVPWFPDVDLDVSSAGRSSRAGARSLGARRRPPAGQEAAPAGASPAGPDDVAQGGSGAAGVVGARGYARRDGLTDTPGDDYDLDDDDDRADLDLDYSLASQGLVDVAGDQATAAGDDAVTPSPVGSGALVPAVRPVSAQAGPPLGVPTGPSAAAGWRDDAAGAPELLDPRVAARRFAQLLADEDRARGAREARLRAGREETEALAETYRDNAAEIRGQVRRVWRQVSEALAPFGVDDLEQVRGHEPAVVGAPAAGALPGIGLDDEPTGRRSLTARGADRDRRGRVPAARRAPAVAGPRGADGAAGTAVMAAADDGPLDVAAEVEQARRLWMRALATAAELRGVQRASSSLSVGLVTAGACVLVAALAGAARLFLGTQGLPCLVAGLIAGAALVSVSTDGGAKAAVRSALLSAGVAGAVVLATARVAPTEPAAIVLSLASLAGAVRFGLGFGASKPPAPAPGAPAKRRR